MASSIAKQPWRLGVIVFLLLAFVASLFAVQSYFGVGPADEAGMRISAGSQISSSQTAPLPGRIPPGPSVTAGGSGAPGDTSLFGITNSFATYVGVATPVVNPTPTTDIPPDIPPVDTAGSLSGTVWESIASCGSDCGPEADRLGDITVYLADAARNPTGKTAVTSRDGQFLFSGLAPGKYNLFFADPSGAYISEWYVPQTIIAGDTSIQVEAEKNTEVSMYLKPTDTGEEPGGISGVVRNSSGKGIAGVTVLAYQVDEAAGILLALKNLAVTDIDGKYHITGLPPEPPAGGLPTGKEAGYKIFFSPDPGSGYAPQWYLDQPTHVTAKLIGLLPGEEIDGIDAVLDGGGTISGHVYGDGRPLAGVTIDIFDESGVIVAGGLTGPAGEFLSRPLDAGSYRIRASGMEGFEDEWYNDKQSFATADPVAVIFGEDSSGLEITLAAATLPVVAAVPAAEEPAADDDVTGTSAGEDEYSDTDAAPLTDPAETGSGESGGSELTSDPGNNAGVAQYEQSEIAADRREEQIGAG